MTRRRGPLAWRCALTTAAVVMAAAAGCGQWSGAPAAEAPAVLLPLGPGTTVRVTKDAGIGSPAIGAWGRTVALAWVAGAPGSRVLRVATSRDAAATFDSPRELGRIEGAQQAERVEAGVTASGPAAGDRSRADIWVRCARAGAAALTWRSRDGGRSFEAFAGTVPSRAFPEPWDASEAEAAGVAIRPPSALRAAGSRRVTRPDGASPGTLPAMILDDHGALALAWVEKSPGGGADTRDIVLRRAWIDWSGQSPVAKAFDAPLIVARDVVRETAVLLAGVPGGVVVAWSGEAGLGPRAGLSARRIGLDMTCAADHASAPYE